MINKVTLFHDASNGGQKQWSIWVENDRTTVTVEWGIVGKKLQRSSDTAKPMKTKDASTVALDNYERQLRKKREEGYREAREDAATHGDIFDGLDKNFVPAKPMKKWEDDKLIDLDKRGRLYIQRKRDGRRHLALVTRTMETKMYSRRMEDLTGHLAGIVNELDQCMIPACTILDGEVIIDNNGADDFNDVGCFTNPATEPGKAARTAAQFNVRYMVFDLLFLNGTPVWQMPYRERYELLQTMFPQPDGRVFVAPLLTGGFVKNQTLALAEGWEGLVCWLKDDATVVRIGGKPKLAGCIKWKPVEEDDFIATGYENGSGELSDVAGKLFIEQIDPDTGERRQCGKVGTGFDAAMRTEILSWTFPCVVQVKYDTQQPTGKLRFPVFMRKRDDKPIDECIGKELESEE